jgi:hypothetical protein
MDGVLYALLQQTYLIRARNETLSGDLNDQEVSELQQGSLLLLPNMSQIHALNYVHMSEQ